jgi:AcrR family transcriptional regulator
VYIQEAATPCRRDVLQDGGGSLPAKRTPRRHHHLSHESIAKAALDVIDEGGIEALSVRSLAGALDVWPTSLYAYFPDRDSIVLAVVALLLAEIDLPHDASMSWEDCALSIGRSLRTVALKHPHAFPLVALAADDAWPVVEYGRRVHLLMSERGLSDEMIVRLSALLDAFATGFLLLETQTIAKGPERTWSPFEDSEERVLHIAPALPDLEAAFEEGSRAMILGLKLLHGLD